MEIENSALTLSSPEAEVDAAIRELDAGWDRLPEEALRTCQRHRALAIPRLIAVIEEAARLGKEGQVREGGAHDFALYLLTEFRATEALPAILELLSLQEPMLDYLLGDTLTELTHRMLAVLAADQPDLIESLLASPHLNEYVRWEAGQALVQLVVDGRISRGGALERLTRQLRAAVQARDV
jgi:HEAT repeat protein